MSKATNTVGYQPNWENIAKLVEQGYVREVVHPEDMTIKLYNYTAKAQYDSHWTKDVLICRGLIARDGEVIARPFPKFFNWQELQAEEENYTGRRDIVDPFEHTRGPWHVYEKMDGSLGILYKFAEGDYRIATRGSFTSDQAVWATQYFKTHRDFYYLNGPDDKPWDKVTYLFEIIYPENRIVVDYEGEQGLVLLDLLNVETGAGVDLWDDRIEDTWVQYYADLGSVIPLEERPNHEGYVLVNDKGFRVKVKHDEYVRLHHIMTEVSSRTIWEYLKDGRDLKEILENVPDEFYEWVKDTREDLEYEYTGIEFDAYAHYLNKPLTEDRKELADHFKLSKHPSILFSMLDGKDYSQYIWKHIKPERTLPFSNSEE